ncbi:alkylmercury lyase [Mycobacterium intracellulare subsp. chimaera]|nr:hypothetical protein [Mycobacterium intracellulare]KPN45982.1 alkylmercury lyase [Mycobacterium intracellulare subsp. chimaera]
MRVEHLSSPGCPNAAASRALLIKCLADLGLSALMVERVGAFPSPSVLVDGVDVMRPDQPPLGDYCRLDVPTRAAIVAALQHAADLEK